jgi:hypothetical protein
MFSRNIALFMFVLLSILMATDVISLVHGSRQLGVHVGDWFKYKVTRGGHGNTAWVGDYEFDDWVIEYVLNVSGTTVSLLDSHWLMRRSFLNRTGTHDLTIDGGEYHLTLAGLNVGDTVPSESFDIPLQISQEAVRVYCGENRTVLRAEINYSTPYDLYVLDVREEFWWDKQTGILVQKLVDTTIQDYGEASRSSAGLALIQTSLWGKQTPDVPFAWHPLWILSASATIGMVGIVVSERENLKKWLRHESP